MSYWRISGWSPGIPKARCTIQAGSHAEAIRIATRGKSRRVSIVHSCVLVTNAAADRAAAIATYARLNANA